MGVSRHNPYFQTTYPEADNNKAREEKKWRLWKEAEEKQLRSLGVSALFSFVWRKRDCSLTSEYPFAKYFLFVIVMSISVCSGTPRPAKRQRPIERWCAYLTDSKYRAAPDFAITHKEDNDTPVQSQSER